MGKYTFVVSDERLNTHGFVVRTSGIDYTDFERNPVMYYNHDDMRGGVIGRWENIRVDGTRLLMDAVFDESSEVGARVKKQVDDGFLRCASIGIASPSMEDINGVQTAVKCRLREISIVDIPANGNAVKLYNQQGEEVFTLSDWLGEKHDPLRKTIIALLGLSDRASDCEILEAIEMRSNRLKTPENEVSRAIRLKLIDENDREGYMAMASADIQAFDELIARKEERARAHFDAVFLQAARDGRVNATNREIYEEVANACGYALCERVLSLMHRPQMVTSLIETPHTPGRGIPPRSEWGLKEYRKYAPEELRDNQALYVELLEREGHLVPLRGDTVEHYRKYHPEYLASHPKEYERAMADKKRK